MIVKNLFPLQRIVGKIDNDFNIDNSDWIPRVAAWTIDALSQLKCTPYTWRRFKCEIDDEGFVCCPRLYGTKLIRVYSSKGCLIDNAKTGDNGAHLTNSPVMNQYSKALFGGCSGSSSVATADSFDTKWTEEEIGIFTGDEDVRKRIRVGAVCVDHTKNYVVAGSDKLMVNFKDDFVVVELFCVATYWDEYFNEEVPYIYDDGKLLEALSWYIMMKILQRGYNHPVFSLSGQEPVNPYIQWNKLKDQAAASVKNSLRDIDKNEGWNNFFYNSTFLPRL